MSLQGHSTSFFKTLGSWGRVLMTAMEKAHVTPIFKKGKKEDPGNDRPVSLTTVPGKLLEQILLETMSKDMKAQKGQQGNSQCGFTKGKSSQLPSTVR